MVKMTKRIIPCLDIKEGRVVKGKQFKNIQDIADPVPLAKKYEMDQADALFILDINGEDRPTFLSVIQEISEAVDIPLYVGGGIRSLEDIASVINAGATKVSITSAAIHQPDLLEKAVKKFGGERIILSIDAKKVANDTWHAFTAGGKNDAGLDTK